MITNISVDPVRFNQAVWNALLFTTKTGVTEGKAFFSFNFQTMSMTVIACDDFVIMTDVVDLSVIDPTEDVSTDCQFSMTIANLKILETETRKATEPIDLLTKEGKLVAVGQELDIEYPTNVWLDLAAMLEKDETPFSPNPVDWYINPDRLKQIPRIKIEGHKPKAEQDHPVAMRYRHLDGKVVLEYMYGPSVAGLITSMDLSVLKERGVATWEN